MVAGGSGVPLVTLIQGELAPASGEAVTVCRVCAGHPPPLGLRSAGDVETVAESQPLLGVLDGVRFGQSTVRWCPGDVLLCFTDGATERRSAGRLLDEGGDMGPPLRPCSGHSAG